MQAYAMQTAIESHRRNKPRSMGTLMWQLNDVWPVTSWASVDYYGTWKAVHYMQKRIYQDLIISVHNNSDSQIDIYLVSELAADLEGTLSI
jgi:beta-mannosidase